MAASRAGFLKSGSTAENRRRRIAGGDRARCGVRGRGGFGGPYPRQLTTLKRGLMSLFSLMLSSKTLVGLVWKAPFKIPSGGRKLGVKNPRQGFPNFLFTAR